MVRGKFNVIKIARLAWGGSEVTLSAVPADELPENQRYHKYTPSGELKMTIDNPPAEEFFELGKSYYLDFTPA